MNNEVKLLSSNKMFNLNKLDINYYDYNGSNKKNIDWFIVSQKLYLDAVNYYKHIVNMTFTSVHDLNVLQENDYNIDTIDFKLQTNCYRKKIDGNIDRENEYDIIDYKVNIARTFVQRLNFAKVNEFQFKLSHDTEIDVGIPLSLSSMTIKYKIGGQVR